nr:hypothetical protein [Paenibacillus xylanexedens]
MDNETLLKHLLKMQIAVVTQGGWKDGQLEEIQFSTQEILRRMDSNE